MARRTNADVHVPQTYLRFNWIGDGNAKDEVVPCFSGTRSPDELVFPIYKFYSINGSNVIVRYLPFSDLCCPLSHPRKRGDILHSLQPKNSKMLKRAKQEGWYKRESVLKIMQASIKDSLLHHLFPRLGPFTMATECRLGRQCGCRKKPRGGTSVCLVY